MRNCQHDVRWRSVAARAVSVAAAIALALGLFVTSPAPRAMAADLHAFWDSRCASCHRHAGEFARNHLKIKDGRLAGRRPDRDICAFLVEHGAGPEQAEGVCKMLTAQSATPSLFKNKCAACHDTAAELARTGLVRGASGTLQTKADGRDLTDLLRSHGGLEPSEAAIVVETLRRVFDEVHDKAP